MPGNVNRKTPYVKQRSKKGGRKAPRVLCSPTYFTGFGPGGFIDYSFLHVPEENYPSTILKQSENELRPAVGDLQRLCAQLLLDLNGFQFCAFGCQVGVNQKTNADR